MARETRNVACRHATASRTALEENVNAGADSALSRIREKLESHPHFRGRTHLLQIEAAGGSIVVSGRLPTYYLKQLLQEVIRALPDAAHIDNCVNVSYR